MLTVAAWLSPFHQLRAQSQKESDVEVSGDILRLALPAAALGSTLIFRDQRKSTLRFAASLGTTVALSYSLKRIIDKERPNGGRYSFPSGHASMAFTGAAFLDRRFGWKVGVPAYLLASYTGWTRLYANKHDYWDIMGGAVIGIGSAYLFGKKYEPHKPALGFGRHNDAYMLSFRMNL